MRIFHGHDYYDSALAHGGHDDPIIFQRQKDATMSYLDVKALGIEPFYRFANVNHVTPTKAQRFFGRHNLIVTPDHEYYLSYVNVIVAGKRWHGVHIIVTCAHWENKGVYLWTHDALLEWCKEHKVTLHERDRVDRGRYGIIPEDRPYYIPMADYFDKETVVTDAQLNTLIERGISILSIVVPHDFSYAHPTSVPERCPKWQIDAPVLKDLQFYKVLNAYQVYQELEMWIGGVLPNQGREMVTISDLDKVGKHGFDKWSFRRHKDDPR